MGSLGWPEILMILVVALIIFGPRKLPELGKTIGQSLAQFRRASEDFKRTWEEEVEMEKRRDTPPKPYELPFTAYQPGSEGVETEAAATDAATAETADSASNGGDTLAPSGEETVSAEAETAETLSETVDVQPTITPEAQAVPRQSKRDWV